MYNRMNEIKMKKALVIVLVLCMVMTLVAGCGSNSLTTSGTEENTVDAVMETPSDGAEPLAYADKYIDLHLHLDGAITLDIAKQLAQLQGITLPTEDDEELEALLHVTPDCTSLNEFLERFSLPLSLMQTPEGLAEAAHLVADNIKAQGVIYAEFRFAPQLHTDMGMTQEDAILAVLDGLSRTDLKVNVILCFMRGEGNEAENLETLALAKKYIVEDGGVVALDLAGAEALYPTSDYEELFAQAREAGIPFTIHAGEAAGADSVAQAISFGAVRIGHGVRSNEDSTVLQTIKDRGIFLEMCPTSNRQTCAVTDMSDYPLLDYLNNGLKVTLNTDDMGIEGTTLAEEYRYMETSFGLSAEQEQTLLRNSVEAAFTSQAVKAELLKELGLE